MDFIEIAILDLLLNVSIEQESTSMLTSLFTTGLHIPIVTKGLGTQGCSFSSSILLSRLYSFIVTISVIIYTKIIKIQYEEFQENKTTKVVIVK
jgi:hypothetical protein